MSESTSHHGESHPTGHAVRHTGITEDVLSRLETSSGYGDPYSWLARTISASTRVIVDVGCGSGRMSRELAAPERTVIGLDLCPAEIELASQRSDGPWVVGDALALPIADETCQAVTMSMSLAVIHEPEAMIAEAARVLRPGGVVAALIPAIFPLRMADAALVTRLTAILRGRPRLAQPLGVTVGPLLVKAGLTVAEDRRQRFVYTVHDEHDAERLVKALFAPTLRRARLEDAVEYLAHRAQRSPVRVPVPLRRIVAVKYSPATPETQEDAAGQ